MSQIYSRVFAKFADRPANTLPMLQAYYQRRPSLNKRVPALDLPDKMLNQGYFLLHTWKDGTPMDASLFIAPGSITRDGITIRAYRPGDGPELRIATTSSYEHLRPWMPWATREDSVEAAEARGRRFAAHYLLNEDFVLGIWVGEQLAGGTGFHLRGTPLTLRSAEIGMWIRGSYAGQGLGTRALRVMLKWGFEEWNWERLSWHC